MKQTVSSVTSREFVVELFVVVVLIILELTIGFGSLQRLLGPVVVPLSQLVVQSVRVVSLPLRPLTNWSAPQERIQQLSQQLAQTEGRIAQLEQLQTENAELRSLLENRHLQVKPRRLARPITSSIVPLVWLGENSDVRPGWLVLYKDTLLGQVLSVEGQYARVALLTASNDTGGIVVQTASGVRGIVRASNGRVIVTNVPPEVIIAINERVTTVGQPGITPGKFIGLTAEIERDPDQASQTIVIDQLVSFYQTSVVELEE